MDNFLTMLLGANAFGGPGGPGGLGDAPAPGEGEGLLGALKGGVNKAAGAMQAINPPQAQKPVFSGGVSGTSLPFLQKQDDMISPFLNGMMQRTAAAGSQLPTFAQLLAGGR